MDIDRRGGDNPNRPWGNAARVSPVLWSSSDPAADIDPSTGLGAADAAQRTNNDAESSSGDGSRASKKAKTVSDIEKEVRELLDEKLTGNDTDKVKALEQLYWFFEGWGNNARYQLNEERRRTVIEWDGCHLVLNLLRNELNRTGGPSRRVVTGALRFLVVWNTDDNMRDTMSRFNGVEGVAKAMRALPLDKTVQARSVNCLFNYASQSTHRRYLIEADCVPLIVHAMEMFTPTSAEQRLGIHLLEYISSVDGNDHFDLLIEKGALVAAAKAYAANKNSNDPEAPAIREVSRLLMNKLLG